MSYYGFAWLALCLALAVHVANETLTDFLSVYNAVARAIRQRVAFLPVPTFSFGVWLVCFTSLVPCTFGERCQD